MSIIGGLLDWWRRRFPPVPIPDPPPPPSGDPVNQMLGLHNTERLRLRVLTLIVDSRLMAMAQDQAQRMAASGRLDHNNFLQRMRASGYPFTDAAENAATGNAQTAWNGWMNSPGHKRNILDPSYKKVGIGAYKDPRYGIIFTQEFTN